MSVLCRFQITKEDFYWCHQKRLWPTTSDLYRYSVLNPLKVYCRICPQILATNLQGTNPQGGPLPVISGVMIPISIGHFHPSYPCVRPFIVGFCGRFCHLLRCPMCPPGTWWQEIERWQQPWRCPRRMRCSERTPAPGSNHLNTFLGKICTRFSSCFWFP